MRWTDTITLVDYPMTQDELGNWSRGEPVKTTVFCNRRTVGLSRRSEAVDVGMRADAEVQIRTCDYAGQTKAEFKLGPYQDEPELFDAEPSVSGDYTYLTLGRRLEDE